jgi:hypothetical protein
VSTLVLVADAAYPFDYTRLPTGVHAIAGYVGGDTPHVWSQAEVDAVLATGREWWPIWTAPSRGQAIDAAQGGRDGAGMINALRNYRLVNDPPQFYDVEFSTWQANPAGARAAITAWKNTLHAAGYPHTYAYVPLDAGFDWVAYWTNVQVPSLPAGWVGQQYAGNALGGACDLSVFDLDLVGAGGLSMADMTTIQAALDNIKQTLVQVIGEPTHPNTDSIRNVNLKVDRVLAAVPPSVDEIATAVMNKLGTAAGGAITKQDVIDILNGTGLQHPAGA